MGDGYEKHTHQPQSNGGNPESNSLKSAESYLTASTSTGYSVDAGGKEFSIAFQALLAWGETNGLIRAESEFDFFKRPTNGHGDEHEAWFHESSNRWFKATYANRFGLAWGRDGSATAQEYLSRLVLQNKHFGDDIRLIALVNCDSKLRVLTSQPHISGEPACYPEIQAWFCTLGFIRLEVSSRIAWYLKEENLLVADAHEGNVVRTREGMLVPIDLNIVQPSGILLDWALSCIK